MFSKKGGKARDKHAGAARPGNDLANMLGFGGQTEPDDDDESDLLAELAALEGRPLPAKKKAPANKGKVSMATIDQMAAESMKDIDDDDINEDDDFDENDLLGELDDLMDEDDEEDDDNEDMGTMTNAASHAKPQLSDAEARQQEDDDLQRAMALSLIDQGGKPPASAQPAVQPPQTRPVPQGQPLHPVQSTQPSNDMKSVLTERKSMYLQAIENAKAEGNSSKVRRYQRGLKDLDGLIKKAVKGIAIQEDDIPPQVFVKGANPASSAPPATTQDVHHVSPAETEQLIPGLPTPPTHITSPQPSTQPVSAPSQSNVTIDNEKLQFLLTRQKEFKMAAFKMKQAENMDMARKCLAVSKNLQSLIDDVNAGKDVDVSNVPKLPNNETATSPPKVTPPPVTSDPPAVTPHIETEAQAGSSSAPAEGSAPSGPPPPPQTIMEAFQQRLSKYQGAEKDAKADGNGSKARRMGRIVKQYQDAIKSYKANRPVDYNELPCPPGYGPFPGVAAPVSEDGDDAPLPVATNVASTSVAEDHTSPTPLPVPSASPAPQTAASVVKPSRNQKEYEFLVNRQKEFKILALQAKKADDIENAREYLRKAKGIDPMIAAAESGLRVDVTQVPPLPSKAKRESLSSDNGNGNGGNNNSSAVKNTVEFDGNTAQQYSQIETALQKQIETSEKNLEHYKLLGNLDATKNFQSLLKSSQNDLKTLLAYKKQGSPAPKCQTVVKTFPVIRSNPHLSDAELEVVIIRCTNVPLPSGWTPKDMYTYVTFEMPYPQEKPQVGNTTTKKETVNPEFNESFKLIIERKNRTFGRYCKRNGITVKVNYVRGFLKGDKALGQATIKFEHFNNRCEIHECVDLMDLEKGRKAVGGKIELKLKIREPLVDKDAEIIKENWLVLDTHLRGLDMSTAAHTESRSTASSSEYESLEVLRYEKELFEKKVAAYKSQNKNPPAQLTEAIKSYQQKIHFIQTKMKEGGRPAINEYLVALTNGMEKLRIQAQEALKKNDKETAKTCLTKKKLIDKEVAVIKQRLGF